MQHETRNALVDRLSRFDRVVEVGIGTRTAVAEALVETGTAVTATDVAQRAVPDGIRFVRDDVTDPDRAVYADAEAIYALNLPPELQRPTRELARSVDAACCFTTLGGDPPVVAVERETLPGVTLYTAESQRA